MLAIVLFSFYRILLASTAGNARLLAVYILALAYPRTPVSELASASIKLIAVMAQSAVCVILHLGRPTCFVLNGPFAFLKIVLLGVFAVWGLSKFAGNYDGGSDFMTEMPGYSGAKSLGAMTLIIYSYQGYENVNCVSDFAMKLCCPTDIFRSQER